MSAPSFTANSLAKFPLERSRQRASMSANNQRDLSSRHRFGLFDTHSQFYWLDFPECRNDVEKTSKRQFRRNSVELHRRISSISTKAAFFSSPQRRIMTSIRPTISHWIPRTIPQGCVKSTCRYISNKEERTFSCCCCCFKAIALFLSLQRLFWNQTRMTRGDNCVISTSCSFIKASGRGLAL